MDAQEEKYIQMTTPPVEKLICRLAAPCIISMLVTAFYNMADTYFVGMNWERRATRRHPKWQPPASFPRWQRGC